MILIIYGIFIVEKAWLFSNVSGARVFKQSMAGLIAFIVVDF